MRTSDELKKALDNIVSESVGCESDGGDQGHIAIIWAATNLTVIAEVLIDIREQFIEHNNWMEQIHRELELAGKG